MQLPETVVISTGMMIRVANENGAWANPRVHCGDWTYLFAETRVRLVAIDEETEDVLLQVDENHANQAEKGTLFFISAVEYDRLANRPPKRLSSQELADKAKRLLPSG